MAKEPKILPEDHEQYERDYFDHEMEKVENSCLFSRKALILVLLLAILIAFLCSCASVKYPPVTAVIGTVISVDGDNVLVTFEVVNKAKGSQGSNWFYCPRHSYRKGDSYPDPDKDPTFPRP
jgi:hypothetical protein